MILRKMRRIRAAKQIGLEFAGLGPHLINLKKHNRVALLLSNESLNRAGLVPDPGK